ncbi:MAG: hypothetical protein LBL73_07015 [Synergistaceae bacterium]|jgi:hypothetical protein|nr:hypothetical protein [Synergistaceae bacterium]
MAEEIITETGKKLARLCEDLTAGQLSATGFCKRVDAAVSDEFRGKVSEWEADNFLDEIQYEIEFYEPDAKLREEGLYGEKEFTDAVKAVYAEYRKALADTDAA